MILKAIYDYGAKFCQDDHIIRPVNFVGPTPTAEKNRILFISWSEFKDSVSNDIYDVNIDTSFKSFKYYDIMFTIIYTNFKSQQKERQVYKSYQGLRVICEGRTPTRNLLIISFFITYTNHILIKTQPNPF